MSNINVSTVQQYTIDRLRVSFTNSYDVKTIRHLSYQIVDSGGVDVTDRLKSITDSNDWSYITDTPTFDLYLKENTHLDAGTYTFTLLNGSTEIYKAQLSINYMEDVRVEFAKIELLSLSSIKVSFQPLNEENPHYQTKKMMEIMKFSIIDASGTFFSDNFESLSDVISSMPDGDITEFTLNLKSGKTLPEGYYDIRLTSLYKSRTFSVVEKKSVSMAFMTTNPASIGSAYISKKATGETMLTVIFDSYLEKGMLNSGTRKIIRKRDGKDITSYFDADRVSTTSYSIAGVSYVTRLDIPLLTEFYSLEKGEYEIKWTWDNDIIPDVSSIMNVSWIMTSFENISIYELKYIDFDLPEAKNTDDFLSEEHYSVELDGEEIDPSGIFGELKNSYELQGDETIAVNSDHFGVALEDFSKVKNGNYTFILWHKNGEDVVYDYMGSIDIIAELTPNVTQVYQSDIDKITVVLDKKQPIDALNLCTVKLLDQYGSIDFSSRLFSIENSNVWAPGQTTADRFDILINDTSTIQSGKYLFSMNFHGDELKTTSVSLQYMESRKGMIESIEQTSISTIKITFSEPQSRQFLLSTTFDVERKVDGADYTDRFEYLENVLKADQSIFTEITIPMDHEDSFPAGRYRISFLYSKVEGQVPTTIYGYDVELGYMTNNIPNIQSITSATTASGVQLNVVFGNNLEKDLFNTAVFSVNRAADDVDISDSFVDKDSWILSTTTRRGIKYVKSATIKLKSSDEITVERGTYNVNFSWKGIINYLEDIGGSIFLEYILPTIKLAEVTAMNPTKKTGRIYFELYEKMQYDYFEELKVEVLDPNGNDATAYFSTIQKSNGISSSKPESEKMSMDNFNLDITDTSKITFGRYQFIFYHKEGKVRESHNMISLEINDALSPRIATAEQKAINKILVTLKNSIPRMLLEEFTFKFVGMNKVDYTDWFLSIDQANDWPEDLREVTSFYIELGSGYAIEQGSYLFTMYNGNTECDGYIFDIEHLEGASGEITETKPLNLSTLEIVFREEESLALFRTLTLSVIDENGTDVSSQFEDLASALDDISTDFFDTIELKVVGTIPKGLYSFNFQKTYTGTLDIVHENSVNLPYMSSTYPLLYEVSATKLGEEMDGDDALIMWFSPALEKTLFDNAKFGILSAANTDIDFTNKFNDISSAILDTTEKDGVTYVNMATLEFANKETLNRDQYLVKYYWDGDYSYMKNLEREIRLDYILFPLKSVEQISNDTLKLSFKKAVTAEKMQNSEMFVSTTYTTENLDGTVITEVDFSSQFKSLQDANSFEGVASVTSITAQMGSRDPENPAELFLPEGNYRFIIAEQVTDATGNTLQYAYAGTCDISFMMNSEILESSSTLVQTSYDSLQFRFNRAQLVSMLNDSRIFVRRTDLDTGDVKDYTNMFKDMLSSNYYERIGNDNGKETGYYEDAIATDIVVNEIHYTMEETEKAYAKLASNMAIPAHTYSVGILYNNKEYFKSDINLPFMTADPPNISSMEIVDQILKVKFDPAVEINTLRESHYTIMTNRGIDKDGSIKGDDVSDSFGSILNSEVVQSSQYEITYVNEIDIPISKDAFLASGRYTLRWYWPDTSFLPMCEYTSGLSVLAKGIKSSRTISKDTIEFVLEEPVKAKNLKELNLAVMDSSGNDVSNYFQELSESNADIGDEEDTDTYYVKLEDGETVTSDVYTFTVSQNIEEQDEDDGDVVISNEMLTWMMNIVYMTTDFASITRVDNMSIEKFDVVQITNNNSSNYIGYEAQLISSADPNEIETLTKSNISSYIGKYTRIYGKADITKLTVQFDEEIDASLVNALKVQIQDEDGNDISSSFFEPMSCNDIKSRQVLNAINITFPQFYDGEDLEKFDISVTTADGRDLSDQFFEIDKSNDFQDGNHYKSLVFQVNTDNIIEEYDLPDLSVKIADNEGIVLTGFTFTLQMKTIVTTSLMDLAIKSGVTVVPDVYTLVMSYTNEPDIEGSVVLYPFTFTGELPFLSNNLGSIESVDFVDMESFDVKFSNEELPVSVFEHADFRLVNEDGEEVDADIMELMDSNDFNDISTLADMINPGVIRVTLEEGATLQAGTYNVQFWMDISSQDVTVEDETDGSDDSSEEDSNTNTGQYLLWEKTTSIPYMLREQTNSITSVSIEGIDTLKVTLEKAMDVSLLKTFAMDLYSEAKGATNSDAFKPISESNFFGMHLMPTDSRYIMYSSDGSYWVRFDTGYTYGINKVFYHKASKNYIALCMNGSIMKFDDLTKTSYYGSEKPVTIENYGLTTADVTKKSLNDYVLIGSNKIVIVGNDGVILVGTIDSSGNIKVKNVNSDKSITSNTLTSVIQLPGSGTIVAVGYRGTVVKSTDNGNTWSVVPTGFSNNFTDVYYHSNSIDIVGEDADPSDDDEEEIVSGAVEGTIDTSTLFVVGTNGIILYTDNIDTGFERLGSGTSKSIFAITSHENKIIAVGDSGLVLNISDTEDEFVVNEVDTDVSFAIRDVNYCENKFIACGANGKWLTSSGGNSWTVNSSTSSNALKSISYIPSQYNDTKGDYFYITLKTGQSLGSVNFYSGYEVPTLDSSICSTWTTDSIKDQHVNDIYTQYEFKNSRATPVKWYQFTKIVTSTADEEDETVYEQDVDYGWVECSELDKPHSGAYYFRMRIKTETDVNEWMYSTASAVELPYMTSDPGEITKVSVLSPDDEEGVEFTHPYLQIEFSKGNENALHYANYQVIGPDGNDYTSYFQSLRTGDMLYSSSLNLSGVIIYGNPDKIMSLPAGKYTVIWNWMALAPSAAISIPNVTVKNMHWLMKASTSISSANKISLTLNKALSKDFFVTGDTKLNDALTVNIRKIPTNADDNYSYNYYGYFKAVEESNDFSADGNYSSFNLEIQDGMVMESGKYLVKIDNPATNRHSEKEDATDMWVSATTVELTSEVTSTLPTISTVSLEKYSYKPSPLDESRTPDTYTGQGSPSENASMTTLLSNWSSNIDTLNLHVGDKYTDTSTYDEYYFVYDKTSGDYRWEKLVQKPYLVVTFGNLPCYSTFMSGYGNFTLNEINADGSTKLYDGVSLDSFFNKDMDYWDFETRTISNIKQISRIYIPLDELVNFPGAENATFVMSFKPTCIYETITVDGIELYQSLHDYGSIKSITSFNPSVHIGKDDDADTTAGFIIKFEREQLKTFIQSMSVQITHPDPDNDGELIDDTQVFCGITESNSELFEDDSTDRASTIQLLLSDGQYLDHGTYTVTLVGRKSSNDLASDGEDVSFTYTLSTPWLTTNPPETMTASLVTTGSSPVLRIKFTDIYPPESSILKKFGAVKGNATVQVIRYDGKQGNYTNCFRKLSNSTVVFKYDTDNTTDSIEKYVKQIDIPMKNNCAVRKGTYNVFFTFPKSAKLDSIPWPDRTKNCQFTSKEVVISKLGTFESVKVKGKKVTLKLKKNPDVNTNAKLAKSQAAKVLGVTTWQALLSKLSIYVAKGSKTYQSSFESASNKKKYTNSSVTYQLKKNKKINPGKYKFAMKKGSIYPIKAKTLEFQGVIFNSVGGGSLNAWIIKETNPDGKKNTRIYNKYSTAMKRIKKLRKINNISKYQCKLCKICRNKKLLQTSKISACINAYDFPYQYTGGIGKFFKNLVKKWYKYRTKDATGKEYGVSITLEKGKYIDKSTGELKDLADPNATKTYKCSTKPFPGFKFEEHKEHTGAERQVSFGCDNYTKKESPWSWSLSIATVGKGQFPENNKTAMYFATITWKGTAFSRGFKATKKGKKTKKYKTYVKTLQKKVKKQKKAIAKCNKCKKRTIAEKSGKSIGWNAALFPIRVITLDRMKGLPKMLNEKQSEGGFKGTKKNMGCKKAKFIWTKATVKKKQYTKLKCKNCKAADKTLAVGGFQGIFYTK